MIRQGEEQAREALHTAIYRVCTTAKVSPDRIRAICLGVTGAARPEIAAKIRSIVAELIPGAALTKIEIVGDTLIALEAAFGAGAGVIAIAGTGSIAYGRNAAGSTARAGGWGFAISDEGSGLWIGRRAISAILRAHDQGLQTALGAMIFQAWKIISIDELVQQANTTPPPDFPRLFPAVLKAASDGDTVASDLLTEAGTKLAELVAIVIRRLALDPTEDPPPVATTGSVFRQSPDVRRVFYNTLQANFPGIDLRQDVADPVDGALARARRM